MLLSKINALVDSKEERLGIIEKSTIELPSWWVFYCNSEKYIETGDELYLMLGCGHYAINKHSGEYRFFEALISEKEVQETLSKSR